MPISSGGTSDAIHEIKMQFLAEDLASKKIELLNAQIDKVKTTAVASSNAMVDANKKSTMSITDFRSAYQIAMDVVRVGQQVYAQTINVAQQYDQTILDVMISTGANADAASRMVQVVDDAGVSYGTLKTALKMASKEGIEPNIESLAELSDIFLKLKPGVERNQFLMDKFGKSGMDMQRAMLLGGDALRKMSAEMEGGLVLTQDNIDASEEYRKNVDELTDSWRGFTTEMGNKGIPVLNDIYDGYKKFAEIEEKANSLIESGEIKYRRAALAQAAVTEQLIINRDKNISAADAVAEHGDKLDGIVTSYKETEDALVNLNSSYGDLLKNAMSLTSADQDFAESQQDIKDQQAELMTEKAGLYAWETKEIATIQGKIDDLSVKYDENATEHEKRTQRVLLDMSLEKIAMSDGEAGFSEAEYNKALALAETAGAAEAAAIREAAAMDATSTAIAKGTVEIDKFKQMYDLLTSKEITLTVNQVTNMLRADTLAEQMDNRQQHASGGDFLIPMSYGNEGFRMGNGDTASGGERVTISPRGGSPNADVIAAIERNRVSEERLVQLFENAVLRVMK